MTSMIIDNYYKPLDVVLKEIDMSYLNAAEEVDTFEILCKKINAVGKINKETLDTINSLKDDEVVCSYEHKLRCESSNCQDIQNNNGSFDLPRHISLTKRKTVKIVADRLASWRYSGEPLKKPEIMEENIDFDYVRNFGDLVKANDLFIGLGQKYKESLDDTPVSRRDLRTILTNLENIQVSIGELQVLTFDTEDSIGNDGSLVVSSCVERIMKDFEILSKRMPNSCLSIKAKYIDSLENIKDFLPNISDPDALQCTTSLLNQNSEINVVQKFEFQSMPFLASGSNDGKIRLWNMAEKNLVTTISDSLGKVISLTYYVRHGKQYLIWGSEDCMITVWDLNDQKIVTTFENYDCVSDLAIYEWNKKSTLVSVSRNSNLIQLWDLDAKKLKETLKLPDDDSTDIGINVVKAFYKQGLPHIAVGCNDETVKIVNLAEKKIVSSLCLSNVRGPVVSLYVFQCDGVNILASGNSSITLWDLDSFSIIVSKSHVGTVTSLDLIQANGELCVVTASSNGNLKIWDLNLTVLRGLYSSQSTPIRSISVLQSCDKVFICSASDAVIKIWTESPKIY